MTSYAHIKRCFDLSDEDVAAAVESSDDTRALLKHLSQIATPNTGCAKLLLLFARMATSACEWIDGDLRVDIGAKSDTTTTVDVFMELGIGMRERLLPALTFEVPLEEFTRAVERVPDRIRPLSIVQQTAKKISLAVTAEVRMSSLPPAPIMISDDSVFKQSASAKMRAAPKVEGPSPSLPVVMARIPQIAEVRGGRDERPQGASSARMRAAAEAPSEDLIPVVGAAKKRPASIKPPPKPASVRPPPKPASVKPAALARPPLPKPKPKEVAPPPALEKKSVRPPAKGKSVAPPAKGKSVAPPPKGKSVAPGGKKSVAPSGKKSVAPGKKSVRPRHDPRAEPEDEESIDSGWDDSEG